MLKFFFSAAGVDAMSVTLQFFFFKKATAEIDVIVTVLNCFYPRQRSINKIVTVLKKHLPTEETDS